MDEKFEALQNNLGYHFKDISLLRTALTHSSYANEKGAGTVCNERLEFLGDSVLGFISAGYFYRNYDFPEGELTKHRAAKVCENALCVFARELDIGSALLLGKGELRMGGREKPPSLRTPLKRCSPQSTLTAGWRKRASCSALCGKE